MGDELLLGVMSLLARGAELGAHVPQLLAKILEANVVFAGLKGDVVREAKAVLA
jgi:hypothetical protein